MKFTLCWLREHLETDAPLGAIVEKLTAIGLEVEGVENPAEKLAAFRVARVLTAERHPQADKLQLLTVDAGEGAPIQVVCGAPNARVNLIGVFGPPGAYVPGSGITLKVAAIRGVESRGMMCSARELEIGEGHDGIIELPDDAPVGASFPDYAGLADPVIDVAVTPNRQDAMGVRGIARDLAAAGLGKLRALDVPSIQGTFPCPIEIRTDDPAGCPAFYGRALRGVRNGPSPDWLRRRLEAVGQRSISAMVDMTNYVMLTHGRPLHVYDLAKLQGALVARRARDREELVALNGRTYRLDAEMTVIADDCAVHDIGGIMGGEHSSVTEETTDVLIECAYFDPQTIARTGQRLSLASDARTRFERGVDPAFLDDGLAVATALALELAGGEPAEVVRAGSPPDLSRRIPFNPARTLALAGVDLSPDEQRAILARLGFRAKGDAVVAPSWRRDVEGPADLVEEVVRIAGLDRVPSTPLPRPPGVAKPTATPEQRLHRRLRREAAARGLDEAVTWSFIGEAAAALFGGAAWTLANPISDDMRAMRPSMLPGLVSAARRNRDRGERSVRLFELGRRYLADAERPTLGLLLAGERSGRDWRDGCARGFDAYDAKAEVLALLAAAGAPIERLQVMDAAGPPGVYHPGRSASLRLGPKTVLADFGELHPAALRALDLAAPAVAAELYLDALPKRRTSGPFRPAFRPEALQAVRRDFAFLVDASLAADRLLAAVRGADKAAIADAAVFDVFTGAGVEQGSKSVAVEVVLQPSERSFTDAELAAISDKVVAAAVKLGARLRA